MKEPEQGADYAMYNSTEKHESYWKNRVIDWRASYIATTDHPHRALILEELEAMQFGSLLEMGCASGPNLVRIQRAFPLVRLFGIDINRDAIAEARNHLPETSVLEVGAVDKLPFDAGSVDVVLTDMTLIYVGGEKIDRVLTEIKRVCRRDVIFVEFHSSNPLKRLALRVVAGYNAYDYGKLLMNAGFHDISLRKIPPEAWPGGKPQKYFGYMITAGI